MESSKFIKSIVDGAFVLPHQVMMATVIATNSSNTKGMHTLIDFRLSISNLPNENLTGCERVDILTVFVIPNSAYIDLYELEMRHNFLWNDVAVHSLCDRVDYESTDTTAKSTMLGIEFLGIPDICGETTETESVEHQYIVNNTNSECTAHLHFSLPVHLRYQLASSIHHQYGAVQIPLPDVHVRRTSTPSSPSPRNDDFHGNSAVEKCAIVDSENSGQRVVHRYFDETNLGRHSNSYSRMPSSKGQYQLTMLTLGHLCGEEDLGELCVGEGVVRCSEGESSAYSRCYVHMQMPLGDANLYNFVFYVTVIVYAATTVVLLWLLLSKTRKRVKKLV